MLETTLRPSRVQRVISIAGNIGPYVARHPAAVRHVPSWLLSYRKRKSILPTPWVTYGAINALEECLATRPCRIFEYGSGASTLWLRSRAAHITSVEHDHGWYELLQGELGDDPRVDLQYCSADAGYDRYVRTINDFPDEHFDLVIVDGRERMACMRAASRKVRIGGWLLLDDSERERYAEAGAILAEWRRRDFRGLAPAKLYVSQTTLFQRVSAS